jgi:uncharacterized repeat protein (TIGR03943 family)
MTLGTDRVLRAAGLVIWAGLFDVLLLTGRASRFVGPRTHWVLVFGAIALTLTAAASVASVGRRGHARPLRPTDLRVLAVIATPALLIAIVPSPVLGSFAAGNKGTVLPPPQPHQAGTPITLYDVALGFQYPDYARSLGLTDGRRVRITGFVSDTDRTGGPFELTRFRTTCCAADAIAYSIDVVPPPDLEAPTDDQWLAIDGTVGTLNGQPVVTARSVRPIKAPANPYG